MSRSERVRIHSKGIQHEDWHGNNDDYRAEKKNGFERIKHCLNSYAEATTPELISTSLLHSWIFSDINIALTDFLFIGTSQENFPNSFILNFYML